MIGFVEEEWVELFVEEGEEEVKNGSNRLFSNSLLARAASLESST